MIISSLIIVLLGGVTVMYETKALWHMKSPNAAAWNATLNGTIASTGTVYSVISIVLILFIAVAILATVKGFS